MAFNVFGNAIRLGRAAFVAAAVLAVSGWGWGDMYSAEVYLPNYYSVSSRETNVFGHPFQQEKHYLTSATFINHDTGKRMSIGTPSTSSRNFMGPSAYSSLAVNPGQYDLETYTFAGNKVTYDQQKCGHIGFKIAKGETVVLKGPQPAEKIIKVGKGIFQGEDWKPVYVFKNLPGTRDYSDPASNVKGKSRVVELKSDNPKAYAACTAEDVAKWEKRRARWGHSR